MTQTAAEERWLNYLRQQKQYSQAQADECFGHWQARRQSLADKVKGIVCRVDNKTLILHIEQFPGGEELARIALSDTRPSPESPGGRRQWACLDGHGHYLKPISLDESAQPELVITPSFSFITASSIHTHPLLLESRFLLDAVQQDKRPHTVDLYLSPDSEMLFAAHRQAGEVLVISLSDYEIIERFQIRKPGSNRTLNVCFDSKGEKAYITDNESIQLWIIELDSLKNRIWKSGLGILGNLMPAPDPRYLYLCTQRPQFSLLYFDTETLSTPYSVETKGDSWCMQRILPCDPMQLSPDGKLLYFNTWTEAGGLRTPLIHVIKTSSVRTLRSFPIQDGSQPAMLGHSRPNPLHEQEKLDFQSFLLQENILTEADLQAPIEEAPVELKQERKVAPPRKNFQVYQPPKEDPTLWDQIGQEAEELDLPAEAEIAIVDLLNWAFYRITLTNLLLHNDEVKRLKKLAHELRKQLRTKKVVLAELDDLMGKHSLRTPISREAVASLIKQARLRGDSVRFEDICPLCETPLEQDDGLACPACFYRLDLPEERDIRHKLSAETSSQLFAGQMGVVLPGQNRFYTMNVWRQLLGVFEGKSAEIGEIAHVTVLPNHNYLVADAKGNKVAEYSPGGEQIWKAKLALRQPVMATFQVFSESATTQEERIIIVDQGNQRVLELDRTGRHWRRYPTLKTPEADKPKAPCDVQLTPSDTWLIADPGRKEVLEINARGELMRTFGAEQGIQHPILARRLPNGHTWIVDSNLQACLELSPEGKRLRAVRYWPPEAVHGSHWKDEAAPTWVTRLHNGDLVFAGEKVMMQFSPDKEITRWVQGFPNSTVADQSLLKAQFRSQSSAEVKQKKLAQIKADLKTIHLLAEESDEHLEGLAGFMLQLKAKAGDFLVPPGELGNAMYFLLEGELEMVSAEEEGAVIFTVKQGEICGQQAFSDQQKVEKPGMRAVSDLKALYLERGEFKKAVVKFPKLFQLVRSIDADHQRLFKNFRERKTLALQEELRSKIAGHRIREFPLFKGAEEAFFEELSRRVHPMAYMPEHDIFGRGESGGSLFLLLEGRVSIQRKGDKAPVVELEGGQIFGEMSVILNQPRSATVRTEDYCKVYELDIRHINELGQKFPWFKQKLQEIAESRLQQNASDLAAFEARVGINRPDLPRVDIWALVEMRGDELVYMPSLLQDIVVGYSWQGEMLWHWGKESGKELFQPYRIALLPDSLLVTDTGNGRVLEIERETRSVRKRWRGLQNPRSAALTKEGFLLVAEEGKGRLVTLTSDSQVNWEYAPSHPGSRPHYAEVTAEGSVLFADAGLHQVCEISLKGEILWSWGEMGESGNGTHNLKEPSFAHRLEDGSTLIADTGNHRLVWVRPEEEPHLIKGNLSDPLISPMHVEILPNGEWLVYSVSPEKVVRLSRRGENIWSASLYSSNPQSMPTPSVTPTSSEDRWILDMDRLQELEGGPNEAAEITVEQELQSDSSQPVVSEALQAELEERAQRWQDLDLEPESQEEGDSRWKGLDFLDEVATEVTAETESENLFAETATPLSEAANQAFAFLDEEPELKPSGSLFELSEDALSFFDEAESGQTIMHIPETETSADTGLSALSSDSFDFLDEDRPNLNQTVMQLPTAPPANPAETSHNPFGFLDEILPSDSEGETEREKEGTTEGLAEFSIRLIEEPVIEVEQKVYAAYQPIFGDDEPPVAQPATSPVVTPAEPKMALPERDPAPSLEPQLGDSLVHYFAPEAAESLDEYRLEATPVDELDLAPAPPKPILIEEEPESALPSAAELVFLDEDEPALTREEMIAREAEARLAAIQNISVADPDAEDETPAYTPIFLSEALDHELVKLESGDEPEKEDQK